MIMEAGKSLSLLFASWRFREPVVWLPFARPRSKNESRQPGWGDSRGPRLSLKI